MLAPLESWRLLLLGILDPPQFITSRSSTVINSNVFRFVIVSEPWKSEGD